MDLHLLTPEQQLIALAVIVDNLEAKMKAFPHLTHFIITRQSLESFAIAAKILIERIQNESLPSKLPN